jgi:hypothetical protein
MQSLDKMAAGDCPPEKCFDGAPILRREGSLVILEEKKIGHRSGHWRHRGRGGSDWIPPKNIYSRKSASRTARNMCGANATRGA